jgi:hypothetical protein
VRKVNESKGDTFAMVSNIRKGKGLEGDASDKTISSIDGVDTAAGSSDLEGTWRGT